MDIEKNIHLTDKNFVTLCYSYSGINKGIYNTIDNWFYNIGFENIVERREVIIEFLKFLNKRSRFYKAGGGWLKEMFQEFNLTNQPL